MHNQFLWGMLTMACLTATAFFLKFWRISADRFFLLLSIAFLALAMNWVGLAMTDPPSEARHYVYFVRLSAFVLILIAIIDKNRQTPAA